MDPTDARLLGAGFIEITRTAAGRHAFLLMESKSAPWAAVPLNTTGIGAAAGELIARVLDTSTVPGYQWRSQDPAFVHEGREHVIAAGLARPARRPWREDPTVGDADTIEVVGCDDDFTLAGILHSRIALLWRTAADHANHTTA